MLVHDFTLEIGERGDLFPILKTYDYGIFLPTLVNNAQDFMCLKIKSNFNY